MPLTIIEHPILQHKMSIIRQKETKTGDFRKIVKEISNLMVYEMTRDLKTEKKTIETPITTSNQPFLSGKKLVLVPILRAGLGMVDGILELIPSARVGHIGLYRDEETLQAIEYFVKLPNNLEQRDILLLDPMLATGASALKAIEILKEKGAKNIKLVCLVGTQTGVDKVLENHPDVNIYLVSLDEKLNEIGYISPGLGDAGDRLFGTK